MAPPVVRLSPEEVAEAISRLAHGVALPDSDSLADRIEAMLSDVDTALYAASLCVGNQFGAVEAVEEAPAAPVVGEAAGLSDDE
jgi:hypothetical protein